jgi:hypothetical protein
VDVVASRHRLVADDEVVTCRLITPAATSLMSADARLGVWPLSRLRRGVPDRAAGEWTFLDMYMR